jgi:uncharacterized SAM-binding protein YcdF (DUF218 family)
MFVLLKIVLLVFRPIVWIVVFSLVAALSKKDRRRKIFFRLALFSLLFFTNPFIIRHIISLYETKPMNMQAGEHYTAGVLLGGFVSYNKKDDAGYFNSSSDRFIQTLLLYKTGRISRIIVVAGNGYIVKTNFREADFIKQRLIEAGIPAGDIFTDAASRNTVENAINSKKIIDSLHLPGPYLLISSALHLPRAKMVFRKSGMDVNLYPCDFASKAIANNFLEDYIFPSATALRCWDSFIKEIVGITSYKITGKG